MKIRVGLRGRVAALIGVTAVTAGVLAMAALCAVEKRRQFARLRADASVYNSIVGETVSAVAGGAGDLDDVKSRLGDFALRMHQLESVGWLEVFDAQANVVAHSDPARSGGHPLPEHDASVRRVLATGEGVETESFTDGFITSFQPVHPRRDPAGKPIGVVELHLTTKAIESDVERFGGSMMWVALITSVAASMALFLAIDRRVLKPVRELAESAMRLTDVEGKGDAPQARDEMAELDAVVQGAFAVLGEKLGASEARFRDLLASLPSGVLEVDRAGRITYVNDAQARMLGYPPEELLGRFVWELPACASDRERQEDEWEKVFRGEQAPSSYRMTHRTESGETIEVQVDWAQPKAVRPEPRGFIAVVTDITESARAERELQESEAKLRAVLDNMPVMMGASDLEGKLALWSRECERVTGYSAEEVLGRSWSEVGLFGPDELRRERYEAWRQLRGNYRDWEADITCKDGTKRTVSWSSVSGRVPIAGWSSWSIGVDVTDRVRVERSLGESEAMLRSITDSIPDIVMVVDLDGTIHFVNHPAPGLRKEDVVGASVFDFSPESFRPRLKDALERASAGEALDPFDGEYLGPDGKVLPYEVRIGRVPRTDGPAQLVMSCTDASARRRAEDRFRAHFKHFPIPTYTFQRQGDDLVFVDFNDAAYNVTKGLVPRLLGISCRTLYSDDPDIVGDFERCWENQETVRRDYRYRFRTTGEYHDLDVTYVFVPPDLVMLHADDISDRKAAEEALRRSQESLLQAQRIAHVGNWDWDVVANELQWSDEIYRIFGLEPQEFGATYEAFLATVHPDDLEAVEAAVERALRERLPYGIRHRILRNDGVECVVQEQADVICDESGRPTRMVGTVQDVTLRDQAERQLTLALQEKETLLREIHHRVKNNLQVISSLLYLQSQKRPDASLTHLFEEMQRRVETMALIHENLYRSADLGRVDFRRYIDSLVKGLAASHSGRAIRLVAEVEDVALTIHTAVPCGLIVNELVENAFRHAFPNGDDGTVRIEFHREDDQFVLSVRDDGTGLPHDRERPMTLGLRLVHNLAEQLGARMEVRREHGTSFELSFVES